MKTKNSLHLYFFSLLIYVIFSAYNLILYSEWIFDSILSVFLIIFLISIRKSFYLSKFEFLLLNTSLILHNLGTLNYYGMYIYILEYDYLVHFFTSFSATYIIFDFILVSLKIRDFKANPFCRHRFLLLMMVIAFTAFLGTIIELTEFAGASFFGEGDGLFFFGKGDYGKLGIPEEWYEDTMTDLLNNNIGSICGALFFYFVRFKKSIPRYC